MRARRFANPLNLGVLGASIAGAIAFASWPIAAIGGAAFAALVATDLASRRRRPIANDAVRAAAGAIAAARAEVDRVVAGTPERVRRNIGQALASIDELESHAGVLARRADELATYLATADGDAARTDARAHEARARGARDVAAKADYEAAATAAHERARAIDDLGNTRDRALAHLAKIAAVIQAVPSKLVRLRALDDEARGTLTGDVGAELERMNVDLRAFEQTLESIVEVHA